MAKHIRRLLGLGLVAIGVLGVAALIGAQRTRAADSGPGSLAGQGHYFCDGKLATIVGGLGNDNLVGTLGNDVIVALDGDDIIHGLDGHDTICAGSGNDTVYAGVGNDKGFGEKGNDHLFGYIGNDELFGGDGADHLDGGPQTLNDRCDGGATMFDVAVDCESVINVP